MDAMEKVPHRRHSPTYGITAFSLVLLGYATAGSAQTQKITSRVPSFEIVSFKDSGPPMSHMGVQNGRTTMTWHPIEFKGVRLSCDAPLVHIIEFAFSPLLTPYRQEAPEWTRMEYYKVDAIAPTGT